MKSKVLIWLKTQDINFFNRQKTCLIRYNGFFSFIYLIDWDEIIVCVKQTENYQTHNSICCVEVLLPASLNIGCCKHNKIICFFSLVFDIPMCSTYKKRIGLPILKKKNICKQIHGFPSIVRNRLKILLLRTNARACKMILNEKWEKSEPFDYD